MSEPVMTWANVPIKRKSQSRLMRVIGTLLSFITPNFMRRFWTTIGRNVYVPTAYDQDKDWGSIKWRMRHKEVLEHEAEHVRQFQTWGVILMAIGYIGPMPFLVVTGVAVSPFTGLWPWVISLGLLLTPLSVGLAYFRWRIERSAYLINVQNGTDPHWVAETLWNNYAWAWPKPWARKWFWGRMR